MLRRRGPAALLVAPLALLFVCKKGSAPEEIEAGPPLAAGAFCETVFGAAARPARARRFYR